MTAGQIGWPFVLSRNPWLDWRALRAPAFLIDANADFELVQSAHPGPQTPHPWPPTQRSLVLGNIGRLTLVFASSLALSPEGENQHDRFGRAIRVIYGFVLEGDYPEITHVWSKALDALEPKALDDLAQFWDEVNETWLPLVSDPVRLAHQVT